MLTNSTVAGTAMYESTSTPGSESPEPGHPTADADVAGDRGELRAEQHPGEDAVDDWDRPPGKAPPWSAKPVRRTPWAAGTAPTRRAHPRSTTGRTPARSPAPAPRPSPTLRAPRPSRHRSRVVVSSDVTRGAVPECSRSRRALGFVDLVSCARWASDRPTRPASDTDASDNRGRRPSPPCAGSSKSPRWPKRCVTSAPLNSPSTRVRGAAVRPRRGAPWPRPSPGKDRAVPRSPRRNVRFARAREGLDRVDISRPSTTTGSRRVPSP